MRPTLALAQITGKFLKYEDKFLPRIIDETVFDPKKFPGEPSCVSSRVPSEHQKRVPMEVTRGLTAFGSLDS